LNIPKVTFRSSRALFTNQKDARICILQNEILMIDSNAGTIKSFGLSTSFTNQEIALAEFGIKEVREIKCFTRLNQFIVLNFRKASSEFEVDSTEAYIFVGGARLDAYTMLKRKIGNLNPAIDKLSAFQHEFSTIIYLSSRRDPSFKGEFYRVYNNDPLIVTRVPGGEDFESIPEQVEIKMTFSTEKSLLLVQS
jgi:hypothetical protein